MAYYYLFETPFSKIVDGLVHDLKEQVKRRRNSETVDLTDEDIRQVAQNTGKQRMLHNFPCLGEATTEEIRGDYYVVVPVEGDMFLLTYAPSSLQKQRPNIQIVPSDHALKIQFGKNTDLPAALKIAKDKTLRDIEEIRKYVSDLSVEVKQYNNGDGPYGPGVFENIIGILKQRRERLRVGRETKVALGMVFDDESVFD